MNTITTYDDVSKIINKEFVMIIAKSHTCTACQTIGNMLQTNVKNLEDIKIYNIYIDDLDQFRGDFLVFSVPTVLIFSNGKELLRESRYINYSKIERLIELYTN